LNFLAEFSYNEIANKRTRATDEIESILNKSVTDEAYTKNWYEQNIYIKEQIYFYFNAKYARIGFKINGKPFSLLDDYKAKTQNKADILNKYLAVFKLEGTEQNNYKHMMGSCKKILRSLSESDLNNEWLLRLLKAFSMYSINNASYISEANEELEKGFIKLYEDLIFHNNDYKIIEPIFENYFTLLEENIKKENKSFKDIKLIRAKILIKMQTLALDNLITENNKLKLMIYA
jgi:ATP-dependent DNA helicase RecQ